MLGCESGVYGPKSVSSPIGHTVLQHSVALHYTQCITSHTCIELSGHLLCFESRYRAYITSQTDVYRTSIDARLSNSTRCMSYSSTSRTTWHAQLLTRRQDRHCMPAANVCMIAYELCGRGRGSCLRPSVVPRPVCCTLTVLISMYRQVRPLKVT